MKKLLPIFLLLGACTKTVEVPVIKEVPVEVKVPVSAPCVAGEKPTEPEPLRNLYNWDEWQALTTDQRGNLVADQALARKVYGDQMTVVTAGCQ